MSPLIPHEHGSFIHLENITKKFGEHTVLDSIDIKIKDGEILGLIGRSGCGKSTFLKILMGFYKPTSGKIFYKGKNITKNTKKIKKLVGYTTQENSFHEKLTIFENMVYYARLYSIKLNKKQLTQHIDHILENVGLLDAKNRLSQKISGGMKRRLDFAISLVHNPKILILDEPTTGLDPILVENFWNIVKSINKQGKTVIIITHLFKEIEDNCDRFAIINKGRFDFVMNVKEFNHKYPHISFEQVFREVTK